MEVANTLAYYDTATITAVKSFIVQAPGGSPIQVLSRPNVAKLQCSNGNLCIQHG
jgi:hypothetical protein